MRAPKMTQKPRYFVPNDNSGTLRSEHVRRLEAMQRRLLDIENEPIVYSATEFYDPDDAFLLNQDLYRINRSDYNARVLRRQYPIAKELRTIAREIEQSFMATKQSPPTLRDYYWVPQSANRSKNVLDYSRSLYSNRRVCNSCYLNHSKKRQLEATKSMEVKIQIRPFSASPSPEIALTESERQNLRDMCRKPDLRPVEIQTQRATQYQVVSRTPSPPRTGEYRARMDAFEQTGGRSVLKAEGYENSYFKYAPIYADRNTAITAMYRQQREMRDAAGEDSRVVDSGFA